MQVATDIYLYGPVPENICTLPARERGAEPGGSPKSAVHGSSAGQPGVHASLSLTSDWLIIRSVLPNVDSMPDRSAPQPGAGAGPSHAALALAVMAVILHVIANAVSPYGWQRDEFLYFAMGDHLRLWHMDFPPFIAIAARLTRALLGDSLVATRILPAFAHGVLIWMAALIARTLGGGRFAEGLAALAVFASPIFMRPGSLFQPVIFDQLWWTAALACVLLVERTEDHRWWIGAGAALGLGLLTKFSIGFIALPLALGVLLTRTRRWLRTPWPWAAAGLAVVIGLPSITGQLLLGFPVVSQMRDLQQGQLSHVTVFGFLGDQLLFSPLFAPLSVWALADLFRRPATRAVAAACAGAAVLLIALHGKSYYVAPIYPTLFAGGAVCVERIQRPLAAAARIAVTTAAIIIGVLAIPLGYPVVPPAQMARYSSWLGVTSAVRTNRGDVLPLPQDYADMLGWEELVGQVAKVYHALTSEEQSRVVIFGQNYGRAGAVDFFAKKNGIPRSVSGAGSYWYFGPGDRTGSLLISVGSDHKDLDRYFDSVVEAAHTSNPMGVPEERSVTIWLCRGMRNGLTLQAAWPSLAGRN